MKSNRFSLAAAAVVGAAVVGLSVPAFAAPGDDAADKYFNKQNPKLSPQEVRALDLAKRWSAAGGTVATPGAAPTAPQSVNLPMAGSGGVVRFPFGAVQPSIVCAVLQVCDIALQAGEQVNSIQLGDTARWTVEPAISGAGPTETLHLIVKPMDVGLETSLAVHTNKRTYHMRLRSHRTEYMPQVAFTYPEDQQAKWDMARLREQKAVQERQDKTIPATGEYLGNLSFEYTIDGSTPWKPSRVYNDGKKTIIEMPKAMSQTEAPTLLVVRKDGGIFTDAETVMVNYRVQSDRYIVDTVFDKAILVSGVGSSQDRITITRSK
jgi:type IV secretion system protein TrbG